MAKGKGDADLTEMRDRWTYATKEWTEARREGATDMKFVAGDPWAEKDKAARLNAGRPCLALDELSQYVNQLINEIRQHKRGIKVTALGYGANDATARFRADLIRQIEYRSNAPMVYTTGFADAVQRGYGFWRVKSQYVSDETFDQELIVEPLPNPELVTVDPDLLMPDGSDMKYGWIHEWWPIEEFKRRFKGKTDIKEWSGVWMNVAGQWGRQDQIQVAEYWEVRTEPSKLYEIQTSMGPMAVPEDKLDDDTIGKLKADGRILRDRPVERKIVTSRLTNGVEWLSETEWDGTSIPIVCVFGKVLYYDDGQGVRKHYLSAVRLARDPMMLYNYYRTTEAELIGMTPKTPFIGYKGQWRGVEREWQEAAHQPKAFLEANPLTEATGNQILPLPTRQPYDPPIQALEVGAESARRAIQAAIGWSPLPTQAQRRNEKSGKALEQIESAEQRGAFHFVDHLDSAITRTGVILDELIDVYYDAARDVTVRSQAGETRVVRINDASRPDPTSGQPIHTGRGKHDITLSVGPSFESERQEASDFADALAQNQAVFPLVAPLVVKLKNLGPIGDEMAELLEAMAPPPAQAIYAAKKQNQPPPDPRMMQQLQQAQALIQQLGQKVAELTQEKQAKLAQVQAQGATDLQLAAVNNASKEEIAKIQGGVQIMIADLKAQIDSVKAVQEQLRSVVDAAEEIRLAREQHQHAKEGKLLDHGHALIEAEQAHAHALAQQQQAPMPVPTTEQE